MPTEAEWEVAARGATIGQAAGTYSDQYAGTDSVSQLTNYAWYYDNSSNKSHPVGTKIANELTLNDMSGNVNEWCSDWYSTMFPYSNNNPTGPPGGSSRIYRGGDYISSSYYCKVSYRASASPEESNYKLGFRLVVAP